MILRGVGYAAEDNPDLVKTVAAVFGTAPSADVVEVVRCRDCEYWMPDGENVMVCTGPMAYCGTDGEWYCASAKRKGEDNG